jgi:hypothetical protein
MIHSPISQQTTQKAVSGNIPCVSPKQPSDIVLANDSQGGPYGENLASGYPNTTLAIDGWGDEEKDYNYSKKKFSEAVGHFTQLVWSNTTAVGCGLVDCENTGKNGVQGEYLVCEYWPRGNVLGQSGDNVRKKGMAKDGTPGMGGSMRIGRADSVVAALVVVSLLLAAVS